MRTEAWQRLREICDGALAAGSGIQIYDCDVLNLHALGRTYGEALQLDLDIRPLTGALCPTGKRGPVSRRLLTGHRRMTVARMAHPELGADTEGSRE